MSSRKERRCLKHTNQSEVYKQKIPGALTTPGILIKTATTYSPTVCSTIGVTKLNFSVRNGKRWNLRAIVTWISFYVFMTHKKQTLDSQAKGMYHPSSYPRESILRDKESERAISNARLWCLHLYTCILSTSSSLTTLRNLILWPASYLDAFSTYPIPT